MTKQQIDTWTALFFVLDPLASAVAYAVQCQPVSVPPAAGDLDYAAAGRA